MGAAKPQPDLQRAHVAEVGNFDRSKWMTVGVGVSAACGGRQGEPAAPERGGRLRREGWTPAAGGVDACGGERWTPAAGGVHRPSA